MNYCDVSQQEVQILEVLFLLNTALFFSLSDSL